MANLSYPELAEITNTSLPPASLEALKELRNQMCESSKQSSFKLQSHQRFLRRVLSPDSPARSLLMVHGTGVGKTCTAIQIAEEYILRPEFQDKKVLVIASRAVEENFRTQLFDINRVNIDAVAGTLESQQCTGRRYLDMLLRIESEPKNWNNPDTRERLNKTSDKLINEFYEFSAYETFGNLINKKVGATDAEIDREWIHANFDNRLVIIDEAHRIKESTTDSTTVKGSTRGIENLVKIADGLVLVLMTATPMYDVYEEIIFFMNLFLWNDKRQGPKESIKPTDLFNPDGTLKAGAPGQRFRDWCQEYVSYVKGENPFTFPFRLPPPRIVNTAGITQAFVGGPIPEVDRIKYLTLTDSVVQDIQKDVLTGIERTDTEEKKRALLESTVAVLPANKTFRETFSLDNDQYAYTGDAFLKPDTLPNHSAKFVTIIKAILDSQGVAFVYSNFATMGSRLFAMALEEHGFVPAFGKTLLKKPAYEGASKGKYILITGEASDAEISRMLDAVKKPSNKDGTQVRVIISSPVAAEGIDFRFVRQIHVIDPWWNMSRIEQVIGRGLRTCSHQLLPFEKQNCTVYMHVVRTGDGKECYDEYTYRTKVEQKAMKIARVRKIIAESAMDCPLQNQINTLPEDWRNLEVPQSRAERAEDVTYRLYGMMAPMFDDTPDVAECIVKPSVPDPDHTRPLSTYLDVRDELLTKLAGKFMDKPIWDRQELIAALRPYTEDVVVYNLQQAISSAFRFKDSFGRPAVLELKGDLYALAPLGVPNSTVIERTTLPAVKGRVELEPGGAEESKEREEPEEIEVAPEILNEKRAAFKWPADAKTRFSEAILNSYIFDHELSDAERRALLRSRPAGLPFTNRLYVPGTDIIVLGDKTYDPPEEPIGDEGARFRQWTEALIKTFTDNKETIYATLTSDRKFAFSKLVITDTEVKRKTGKQKRYEPIVCGSGKHEPETLVPSAVVNRLAKHIDSRGVGIPAVKNVPDACLYAELLAREEHNCMWVTPEELSVLYDNAENKKAFTTEFKK
jgi:hypothetical protein